MCVSHTSKADSPNRLLHDDIVVEDEPRVVFDDEESGQISGAIARAVGKSESGRDRRGPLPNVRSKLRADRARAIAQRDRAKAEVQQLQHQLVEVHSDLAAAIARAEAAERGSGAGQ